MDPKCNRKAPLWKLMTLSYTNFHDSFIETDSIGCGTQLNRKVPPDENNFSWARLSLLRRLRPLENKLGRLSPFSVSRPTLLDLIWNTVLIHFSNRLHVYLFYAGLIRISKKKMSANREFPTSGFGLGSEDKHRSRSRTPFNITGFAGGVIQFISNSIHIQRNILLIVSNIPGIYYE